MTVPAQTTETTYALSGTALGPFSTVWFYENPSDVTVWLNTGNGFGLVSTSDYTVAGADSEAAGGTVSLSEAVIPGAAWPDGSQLTLRRKTPEDQPTAMGEALGFDPRVYEQALDHAVRQIQDLGTAVSDIELIIATLGPGTSGPGGGAIAGVTFYANIAALRADTPSTVTALAYVQAYAGKIPTGGGWFAYVAADTTTADNSGTVIVDALNHRYYRLTKQVTIEDFGAVADSGATNNTTAINAALAACDDVLIPAYRGASFGFSTTLSVPGTTRFHGQGARSADGVLSGSLLLPSPTFDDTTPYIENATQAPAAVGNRDGGIEMEGFAIVGADANTACKPWLFTAIVDFRIADILLYRCQADAVLQAVTGNVDVYPEHGRIENIKCDSGNGAILVTAGERLEIETIDHTALGTSMLRLHALTNTSVLRQINVRDILAFGSGPGMEDGIAAAVSISGNGSADCYDITVDGVTMRACTGDGVNYVDVVNLTVANIILHDTNGTSLRRSGAGTGTTANLTAGAIAAYQSDGALALLGDTLAQISGVIASECSLDGIKLDGATYCSIDGARISESGGTGLLEANAANFNSFENVTCYENSTDVTLVGAGSRVGKSCLFTDTTFHASCMVTGGAAPVFNGNDGFASVSYDATGLVTLTLTNPTPSLKRVIKGTVGELGATANIGSVKEVTDFSGKSVTEFQLLTANGGGPVAVPTVYVEVEALIG